MVNSTLTALLDLLARERAALIEGDVRQVSADAALKHRLLDQLLLQSISKDDLARLQRTSQHNGRLLAAALSGIRSVAKRLQAQDAPATTYDTLGRRNSLVVSSSATNTRA